MSKFLCGNFSSINFLFFFQLGECSNEDIPASWILDVLITVGGYKLLYSGWVGINCGLNLLSVATYQLDT